MSTPTIRKSRRKAWVATLAAAFGLFLTIGAGNALGALVLDYEGDNGTLTVTTLFGTPADSVTFKRSGGSPGAILVNGAPVIDVDGASAGAAAQVNNVDQVLVTLVGGSVTIDNTNGRVTEPGFVTEVAPFGLNEIEWELLGIGHFTYSDTNAAGAVTIGEYGDGTGVVYDGPGTLVAPASDPDNILINLNSFPADDDADVVIGLAGPITDNCDPTETPFPADACFANPYITVNLNGGDDFVTGKGGNGTGRAVGDPFNFADFDGDPEVNLVLNGGTGVNEIEGGLDDDEIFANAGDVLNGNTNNVVETDCTQNDSVGVWEPGFIGGDTLNLSPLAGPFTIVLNEDGSITITPAPTIVAVDFENVIASAGNDTITGNSLGNYLNGGPGNDTIDGRGGNDVLVGADGDDTLAGGLGDDCVIGNAGNDTLDESAPLNADGTPAYGVFGNGADALDGGPGLDDTVSYAARTNRTVVHLGIISWNNDGADPNADSVSDECDDVFFSTENAITGSGNDILSANFLNNQSDNEFTAGAGNDQITGGAGNDILHEGSAANGADVFEGDSGSDTADYSQRSNGVNVSLDGAGNDGEAGEGDNIDGDTLALGIEGVCGEDNSFWGGGAPNDGFDGDQEPFWQDEADDNAGDEVENVQGGSGNDVLSGNDLGNVLQGNSGNDTISGGGGADNLQGGDGNDILAGNLGNDSLDGGAGTDTGDWQTAGVNGVGVQVNLATGVSSGEGNDVLTGLENVGGSPFADNLRGDAGNNTINGRAGNDAIQGGGGDDVINGGPGNDELNGNGGNDTVRGQSGADTLRGAGGDDVVSGDPGNDTVLGGGGDDKLAGGSGKDFMNGGKGVDKCNAGAPGLKKGDVAKSCEA